jgi:hypothetical protein
MKLIYFQGPVGLIAGLKAGSAASLCGGICGYAGGKLLKKTPTEPVPATDFDSTHKSDEIIEQR